MHTTHQNGIGKKVAKLFYSQKIERGYKGEPLKNRPKEPKGLILSPINDDACRGIPKENLHTL